MRAGSHLLGSPVLAVGSWRGGSGDREPKQPPQTEEEKDLFGLDLTAQTKSSVTKPNICIVGGRNQNWTYSI